MKIRLRERAEFLKPNRIIFLKFVPILVFILILLISVGMGIADPTSPPPPPIGGTGN